MILVMMKSGLDSIRSKGTEATDVSRMGVARDWVVSGQELYLTRNQNSIWSK